MSDTEWRISGGVGEPDVIPDGTQFLTQGLGFPLRPVVGVPLQDSGDFFNQIVETGMFMQWMGLHRSGIFYARGSVVRDGSFLMIANKLTIDDAAPQEDGAPTFSQPAYSPDATDPSDVSQVTSGHVYTFTDGGWLKTLRVWVPDDASTITYRVVLVDLTPGRPPVTVIFPLVSASLTVDAWNIVTLLNSVVLPGQVLSVTLEALNSSANSTILGLWQYSGPSQTGNPTAGNWNQDNQRTICRINKEDKQGGDRSAVLEGVVPTSTIAVVQADNAALTITYRVVDVVDNGGSMAYTCVLLNETGGGPQSGAECDFIITVPIPLATEYAREAAVWPAGAPAWATVTSVLFFNDVNQNDATSGFGVDIEFQPAEVSEDWDIFTLG